MEDLSSIIVKYAEDGASFEDLEKEIVRIAEENEGKSNDILETLCDAKEASHISDAQYNHILSLMVAADAVTITDTGTEDEHNTMDPRQFFAQTGLHKVETVGPGTIIKDRFELMDVLGEGGMGMVYKARDLIKVEAKDRNPYLAIKVLNDNFKSHPESFIALQRECSRTQKLAHPNIATVYDFDKFGSMVYMTMQLLDGKPLNDFIKDDLPKGGLSFEEALPMIEDMGNALSYAHSQSIVHSDFKPGNSFITNEHGVQVLDFGIARAIKRPGQDATLFDAGKLGALTPAYASCEMLEEEEPDPRDDIYALAVVSYILLSGVHPFDKFPATLARDHEMEAKPIKKLSRAQNRALQRGLSFYREDCTPSVKEFLDELKDEGNKSDNRLLITIIIALIAIGLLSVYPIQNYLVEQKEDELVQALNSKDPDQITSTLLALPDMEDVDATDILSRSRDGLVAYYQGKVDAALTGSDGPNNFELANRLIDQFAQWYPQSEQAGALQSKVVQRKARIINYVDESLTEVVSKHDVKASGGRHTLSELYAMLEQVDPNNLLRTDRRIPLVYADLIDTAMDDKRVLQAAEMLEAALVLFPNDSDLLQLQAEIDRMSDVAYSPTEESLAEDATARKQRKEKRDEALAHAKLEAAKRSIIHKSDAGQAADAKKLLDKLKGMLPEGAVFVTDIAPRAIANSYLKLAEPLAEAGQYDQAISLIESGLEVSPADQNLKSLLKQYQAASGL